MSSIRNFGIQVFVFFTVGAGCSSVDCEEVCVNCGIYSPYCSQSCESGNDTASAAGCMDVLEAYYQCKTANNETCAFMSENRCDDLSFQLGQCMTDFCREEPESEYC
jgi:hypothetical protein